MVTTRNTADAVVNGETPDRQDPMEASSPDYSQFARMWLEFLSRMAAAGVAPVPGAPPTDAAREVRDAYFQSLNRNAEQFLRSPQFLEMMRQSTEMTVALRQQFNDFLAQTHQSLGGVARADVDSILMAVRRCESRVLDKLDDMSSRLEVLENAVQAMESENVRPTRKSKS